jgi:histone-lysine N-methyltransferase SETMAR
MNPESLPTIQKQKGRACNGKPKTPPCPKKKVCMSKLKIRTMLIVFFDSKGILLHEYVPLGQTVNQHYYITILECLGEQIWKKRLQMWCNSWQLHHDSVPACSAFRVIQEFLAKKNITVLEHPPYSPDLAQRGAF